MTKTDLTKAVEKAKSETQDFIQILYKELPENTRKQFERDDKIKKMINRHNAKCDMQTVNSKITE